MRIKAIFWSISSILSLMLACLLGWTITWYPYDQNFPSNPLIGNKVSNVMALKETGLPFSFLVIGDTHNSHRAMGLIKRALKNNHASFMIILGDFVAKPNLWDHHYFTAEMAREINPHFPVFLVPGNHDIDYTASKIDREEGRVTPEVYESLYGPRNFSFTFNGCLFIICGIDLNDPEGYLNYLRNILFKDGKGKRYIFIFEHHPPKLVGPTGSFSLPNEEEFFSLLETYKVKTCFFGDYHAYRRGQRGETNLVVSGGGGRLKNYQPEWGKFNHIMRITVGENMLNEEIMILKGELFSLSGLRKWIFINLFPMMKGRNWILYSGAILFLSLGIFSVVCFILCIKRK